MATVGCVPRSRLRRSDRLRSRKDFRRVGALGERRASRHFVVLVAAASGPAAAGARRLGVTVSRRVGGAVVRSRVKRSIREWFRLRRHGLPPGVDLVVIAKRGAGLLRQRCVEEELEQLLQGIRSQVSEWTG